MPPERLQKILSRAGIASRRGAEQVMAEGRVTVNGETVRELGTKADAATDDIRVDGVRVKASAERVYIVLYKPRGVVTTRHDPEGRATVMDLVPPVAGLFPVGRLDVGTEGLIVLTNDGAFAERVSHPRYEVPRVYQAKVRDIPTPETLARLTSGVRVEGERLAADSVRLLEADNNSWLELTLHEGKNHEVRRLMEAVGHPVSKLKRVALGPLTLRGMSPGEFRHLTPQEIRALSIGGAKSAKGRPAEKPRRLPRRPARPAEAPRASTSQAASARPATPTGRRPTSFRPSSPATRDTRTRPAERRPAGPRRPGR